MDDMNAFERQVAGEVIRAAAPARPVDAAAVFAAIPATTRSPKWRFQSMFSATKFVVAGAIVTLFGGFVLTGVLTQPSEDRLPAVGASASATTQAEPTDPATSEPEPTTAAEADTSTTTLDLLPGVDLMGEEFEPGVFRVTSDGVRDLSRVTDHTDRQLGGALDGNIAAGLDGSVWWFGPDGFFRLGDAATHAWAESALVDGVWAGDDLGVTPDGMLLRYSDPEHAAVFDGRSWTEREVVPTGPAIWLRGGLRVYDGERFETLITPVASYTIQGAAVGADGTIWIKPAIGDDFTLLFRYGLNDAEPAFSDWQEFSPGLPQIGGTYQGFYFFEVAPDGSVWFNPDGDYERTGTSCDGIASFDGEAVAYYLRDTCVYAMAIAPDGQVWLQAGEPGEFRRQHGSATTIHTYVINPEAMAEQQVGFAAAAHQTTTRPLPDHYPNTRLAQGREPS